MKSGKLSNVLLVLALLAGTLSVAAAAPGATSGAADLPLAGAPGHGQWLYRAETGVEAWSNGRGEQWAYPSAYRWPPETPAAALDILIYADDPTHMAPYTFLDQALRTLGLGYTAHYNDDFAGFEASLTGGHWDLVLFGNDYYEMDIPSTWTALDTYVAGGGRLVLHSWAVGSYPGNPLWTTLGFTWASDDSAPPDRVYWWQPGHPIFGYPLSVPEFTALGSIGFSIYGQHVEPLAGAEAIAGYTMPGPDLNQAALVLNNDGRTVFKGFVDAHNSADRDGDALLDGIELWMNLIAYLTFGLSATPDRLSADLLLGTTDTQPIALTNIGAAPVNFRLVESDHGSQPAPRRMAEGDIVWLARSEKGVPVQGTDDGSTVAYPGTYRYIPAHPAVDTNILVYADDWVHAAPNTLVQQALARLGLPATVHVGCDYAGFEYDLAAGGPWDLVIYSSENCGPSDTVKPALLAYLQAGGKVAATEWRQLSFASDPLWAEMGFVYLDNYLDARPAYWWDPAHILFTDPESAPQWINRTTPSGTSQGTVIDPLPNGLVLAGYTTTAQPGQGAIVVRDDGRAVYKAIRDVSTDADDDGDGVLDGIELWENIIDGMLRGFDVPWLAEDPTTGTVGGSGGQVVVGVTFDAGAVAEPGEYQARLTVTSDDPISPTIDIPITMTVTAPAGWGKLAGTVTGLGYCDAESYPLGYASVVAAGGGVVTVTTDLYGEYVAWLQEGTYEVIAVQDGYVAGSAQVTVVAQQATTQDFDLRALQPCLSITPPAMEATLLSGTSETQALTLRNDGAAPSEMVLVELGPLTSELALGKEIGPLSRGGPDPFGYRFADSHEPGGPEYEWIEIAPPAGGGGAPLDLTGVNDGHYWPVDLPWPFSFYGNNYTRLAVASNGTVYFEDSYLGRGNVPIPGANDYVVNTFIAHWWDDLFVAPGDVYYLVAGDRVIIEYYQTSACCTSPDHATWEVILFANGSILMQYQDTYLDHDADHGAGATVGLQKSLETGLQYSFDAPVLHDGLAICFAYPGNPLDCSQRDVPWLAQDPISGTVPADDQLGVDVTFTAFSTMPLGVYTASLLVWTEDAQTPNFSLPLTLNLVSCVSVTAVSLAVVTPGPIYPYHPVNMEAAITPYNTSMPYHYRVDYGDGTGPFTGSSSDDPLSLTHSFASPGTHLVTISVWNCDMVEPVVASYPLVTEFPHYYLPLVYKHGGG